MVICLAGIVNVLNTHVHEDTGLFIHLPGGYVLIRGIPGGSDHDLALLLLRFMMRHNNSFKLLTTPGDVARELRFVFGCS